jgi:CRISPR/Cas system-associated exonuclease Cas4 (RecB family)
MKINHISISREGQFLQCPQSYKYKYHLGILPEEEAPHFFYGKIVHKIIENYTLGRGLIDINDITQSVLNGDIKLEDDSPSGRLNLPYQYNSKLPKHLASFMKLTNQIGTDGLVEWDFEFDLDPPNKRCLVGFIDRIIRPTDEKVFILDYKTTRAGQWRKNRQTVTKDLQLQSYARVIQREWGIKAENIKAALFYLDDPVELISTGFTQETLDSVEPRLLKTYKEIESLHPDNVIGKTGDHCFRCDYQDICPFFNAFKSYN